MDLDGPPVQLCIASTWDGALIPDDERATVTLRASADALIVEVTAQFHGDPPPATPPAPGGTWELWEHEVVELFLVAMPADDGEGDGGAGGRPRYTELELGPHGHHLLLGLDGVRDPSPERALPFGAYEARVEGARWTGRAALPWDSFPARPSSAASASSEEPLRVNADLLPRSRCATLPPLPPPPLLPLLSSPLLSPHLLSPHLISSHFLSPLILAKTAIWLF